MDINSKTNQYSEVYSLLNALGPTYINAIPQKLYKLIDEKREKLYNPKYDLTIPLYKQNISKKATALICLLHYNYWCKSEEEKNKIDKILKYNTKQARDMSFKYEAKFNNNKNQRENDKLVKEDLNKDNNCTAIAVKNKNSIFKKIWNLLKRIWGK